MVCDTLCSYLARKAPHSVGYFGLCLESPLTFGGGGGWIYKQSRNWVVKIFPKTSRLFIATSVDG